METKNETSYWLALCRSPHLTPIQRKQLQACFPSVKALFKASKRTLQTTGLKPSALADILSPDWVGIEQDLIWAEQPNAHIIPLNSPQYPYWLTTIPDPPTVLFVKGSPKALNRPQLAIVGSRLASPAGLEIAYQWSGKLAQLGLTITSGLAIGIDTASHQGALSQQGVTLAVLGCGLDRLYPQQNASLAGTILANGGALISELPTGTQPLPHHFPKRNRIISGLSRFGVLVVEASTRSGSLITARMAAEQGREVFAVPGSPYHALAKGCHQLIHQGAKLTEKIEDIMSEFPPAERLMLEKFIPDKQHTSLKLLPIKPTIKLDQLDKKLLKCVGFEPTPLAHITQRSELPITQVITKLTAWVIQGWLSKGSGGYTRTKSSLYL